MLLVGVTCSAAAELLSLEELAYRFGTDKSHDDHKYVDLYSMLLDPIRERVYNMTEIGVAAGQSLEMWHAYLPNSLVWGIDMKWSKSTEQKMARLPRVRLRRALSDRRPKVAKLHFAPNSMDLIIDDGDHYPPANDRTLLNFWPFLRPGGLYIVEDVATGARFHTGRYGCRAAMRGDADWKARCGFAAEGSAQLAHNVSSISPALREILEQNDAFFADTLVGHRAFDAFRKGMGVTWMRDRVNHNSHVLVVRKRTGPRARAKPTLHYGKVAMPTFG
jgi:hypothetical protein